MTDFNDHNFLTAHHIFVSKLCHRFLYLPVYMSTILCELYLSHLKNVVCV